MFRRARSRTLSLLVVFSLCGGLVIMARGIGQSGAREDGLRCIYLYTENTTGSGGRGAVYLLDTVSGGFARTHDPAIALPLRARYIGGANRQGTWVARLRASWRGNTILLDTLQFSAPSAVPNTAEAAWVTIPLPIPISESMGGTVWSPDGRLFLLLASTLEGKNVLMLSVPESKAIHLAPLGGSDRTIDFLAWSGDSSHFLLGFRQGGNVPRTWVELWSAAAFAAVGTQRLPATNSWTVRERAAVGTGITLYYIPRQSRDADVLFVHPKGFVHGSAYAFWITEVRSRWSPDGVRVLLRKGGADGIQLDIAHFEKDTLVVERTIRPPTGVVGEITHGDWTLDGAHLVYGVRSEGMDTLYRYRLADGVIQPLLDSQREITVSGSTARQPDEPRAATIVRALDRQYLTTFYWLSPDGGTLTPFLSGVRVQRVIETDDGRRLLVNWLDPQDRRSRATWVDLEQGISHPVSFPTEYESAEDMQISTLTHPRYRLIRTIGEVQSAAVLDVENGSVTPLYTGSAIRIVTLPGTTEIEISSSDPTAPDWASVGYTPKGQRLYHLKIPQTLSGRRISRLSMSPDRTRGILSVAGDLPGQEDQWVLFDAEGNPRYQETGRDVSIVWAANSAHFLRQKNDPDGTLTYRFYTREGALQNEISGLPKGVTLTWAHCAEVRSGTF